MSWEYLRLQVGSHEIVKSDEQLAQLGREGWELVAVAEAAGSYIHMWFKRRRGKCRSTCR
jgi:hypothetical protein